MLVVAEADEIVFPLTEALHNEGCSALSAGNFEEALDLLGRHPVDVVISDIRGGGRNSMGGIAEIRALYPSIALMAIAGGAEDLPEQPLEAIRDAGAEHIFSKPLDIAEVIATLSDRGGSSPLNRQPAAGFPAR